jgi:hypothetical protein
MTTIANLEDEMYRIMTEAERQGIILRLIGGLAVKVHSPAASRQDALGREYPDIDFVTDKAGRRKVGRFLSGLGYAPNQRLNTLTGDLRQLYYDEQRGRHIDIFIGDFEMCHKLPLHKRLHLEPLTLPLAELFLTKAQIVELNRKDALDLMTLVLEHPVGYGDAETINLGVITRLCSRDWGLYITVTLTIKKLLHLLNEDTGLSLDDRQKLIIRERLAAIQRAMKAAPKSITWRLRNKVGTRMRWYNEVEEIQR